MGKFEGFIGVNFWTALFVLLNTLAIFFVARKYLFKPVSKLIRDRQTEIDEMYKKADESKREAEGLALEYSRKLSGAQAESDRLIKDAALRAEEKEQLILRDARTQAALLIDKAEKDARNEKVKAVNAARDEIASLAVEIAGKIVEREINDADQTALVDGFIKKLGERE